MNIDGILARGWYSLYGKFLNIQKFIPLLAKIPFMLKIKESLIHVFSILPLVLKEYTIVIDLQFVGIILKIDYNIILTILMISERK